MDNCLYYDVKGCAFVYFGMTEWVEGETNNVYNMGIEEIVDKDVKGNHLNCK